MKRRVGLAMFVGCWVYLLGAIVALAIVPNDVHHAIGPTLFNLGGVAVLLGAIGLNLSE